MMGQRRGSRIVAIPLVVAIVFVVGACGSSSSKDDATGASDVKVEEITPADSQSRTDTTADVVGPQDSSVDTPLPPLDLSEDVEDDEDVLQIPGEVSEIAVDLVDTVADMLDESDLADVAAEVAPPEPGEPWKFIVILSGALVGKEYGGFGDELVVECFALDGAGLPLGAPDDLVIGTDAPDAAIDGNTIHFSARGQWIVTCHSDSLGIDGEAQVSVPSAALGKQFTLVAKRLGTLHFSLGHLVKSALSEDSPNVSAVCQQLNQLAQQCQVEQLANTDLLLPYPGGWPDLEELVAAGITAEPDDAAWVETLAALISHLEQVAAALQQLAQEMTEENAATLEDHIAEFAQLVETFAGLEPSAIAMYQNLDGLRQLMGPGIDAVTRETALAVAAGCTDERWTLQEVMMTVAIKAIQAAIPSYNDCLKEASKAGTQLLIMLELFEVVQEMGASGTPVIYIIYGPGAQVVNPGLEWKINGGGFAWEPDMTIIMFIPPEVAKNAADQVYAIVDFFQNLYSFFDGMVGDPSGEFEDFWDWIQTGKSLANTINDEVNSLVFGDEACAQNYQLVPYKVDGEPDNQTLHFEPFPTKVNCSFIPQDSIMVPINLITGNGEAQLVLVTKEQPGSCNCE